MYGSLNGRSEANENIREICAFNQLGNDKTSWWNFIDNINQNCNLQNSDLCWEDQAKSAGLNTVQITECFNQDAVAIIENEIATAKLFRISNSPTVLVNDVALTTDRLNITTTNLESLICNSMTQKSKACSN